VYGTDYTETISQIVRQIIDSNDADFYHRLKDAVIERLRHGSGYPDMTSDEYRDLLARGEAPGAVHDVVSGAVTAATVDRLPAGLSRYLLGDLLNPGCRTLWEDIASAYLPDVAEYAAARGEE
jgi:hypothetical protein